MHNSGELRGDGWCRTLTHVDGLPGQLQISSAARKQMSWRALLPDIQRHRQNDGLKNGLCEPRPVLQRAKASSDQLCLLTRADSEGERGREGVASVSERARASEGVCYFSLKERCGCRNTVFEECAPSGSRL